MKRALTMLTTTLAMTCFGAVACNPTAGIPITVQLAFESLSDGRAMTASGWDVQLDEAKLLLGPLYAYAPLEERTASCTFLALPVARAHGGFNPLANRIVRAEYLEQFAFDALSSGLVEVGSVDGLLGAVDELSVVLDEPRGDHALGTGPTRGHHVFVHGTATRGEDVVVFEASLNLEDIDLTRRVDGIPVAGVALDEGATLVVGVDASVWLAEANFDAFVGLAGTVVLDETTQPHRALRLGARTSAAYTARILEGPM